MDYSLWSSAIFGKNMTEIKIHFYDIVWKVFLCWSQWCNSQLHISFMYQDMMRLFGQFTVLNTMRLLCY